MPDVTVKHIDEMDAIYEPYPYTDAGAPAPSRG